MDCPLLNDMLCHFFYKKIDQNILWCQNDFQIICNIFRSGAKFLFTESVSLGSKCHGVPSLADSIKNFLSATHISSNFVAYKNLDSKYLIYLLDLGYIILRVAKASPSNLKPMLLILIEKSASLSAMKILLFHTRACQDIF